MVQQKVFVTRRIPEVGLARIREVCQTEVWPEPLPPPPEVLAKKVEDCDGLLSMLTDRVDAFLMDSSPNLRIISNYAVGFNNIDVAAATERRIPVGNTPDVLTEATADMAFCLLIAAARRLPESGQDLRAGKWKTWEPLGWIGQDLREKTLGILGMGRIGYALAARCARGWDMRVLYHDRFENSLAAKSFGATQVDLDTLLAESDFVSVHTDLNDSTRGLFGRETFAKMKPTAVFVNTARGPIHDPAALYDALRSGEIFAAGLDVTDPEPIPMDDPLLTLPNAVIAPHIASATVRTRNAMAEIAADNLLMGLEGKTLHSCVNPEVQETVR